MTSSATASGPTGYAATPHPGGPSASPGAPSTRGAHLPRLVGPAEAWDGGDDRVLGAEGVPGPQGEPAPPAGPVPARERATWSDRVVGGLWSVAYVCSSLVTAVAAIVLVSLAVAGFFSLFAAGAGVLLLVPAAWGAWALARLERHRIAAFLGVDIGDPPPSTAPTWRRVLALDEPRLKAVGWAGIHALWGLLTATWTIAVLSQAALLVTLPLWGWSVEQVRVLWLLSVQTTPLTLLAACATGLLLLALAPVMTRGLAGVDVALARWLVGADPEAELRAMSRRVETLTTTRTQTLDSVEAERRRIERDLHDGPQQRMVSIAMNLGLARDALDREPDDPAAARLVRDLVDEAHTSAKEAITEMRHVARGIVPPILTDRGLDAAVSALADRSPVPVTVTSRLPLGRLEPTTEAVAYFCASEALTNIAKHARATRATVELATARGLDGDLLAITVSDDGRGGAVVGGGTGLTGLRQRAAAVDGQVHVHSPVGSGTTVAITLPLRLVGGPR